MSVEIFTLRMKGLGLVMVSIFAVLVSRLWFLQIVEDKNFRVAANEIHTRIVHEQGPRGRILDVKGRVLVDNRVSIVVMLDNNRLSQFRGTNIDNPREAKAIKDRKKFFVKLAIALGNHGYHIKASKIEKLFLDPRYGPTDFVPLIEDVTEDLALYLAENHINFPGVVAKRKSVRTYPYGQAAAHVLGYVGQINEVELKDKVDAIGLPGEVDAANKPYAGGDEIGKAGVERVFESDLRGVPGDTKIQVDAKGNYVGTISEPKLSHGSDIWLTIDIDAQILAEKMLYDSIANRRGQNCSDKQRRILCNTQEGSLVVVNPQNGTITATATYPTYDPNQLTNGISSDVWASLNDPARGKPMFNRALSGNYSPGSTFKLVTAHAGTLKGLINPTDTMYDGGVYKLENCKGIKCEFFNAGKVKLGVVDLARSITVSSDVYYYRIGDQIWRNKDKYGENALQESAESFGFGSKTSSQLSSESSGLIATPAWLKKVYEKNPSAWDHGDWKIGDSINVAIGQGLTSVTPIQLANAYATFANGGSRYETQIVYKVTHPKDLTKPVGDKGNTDFERVIQPVIAGRVTFAEGVFDAMVRGFVGVVKSSEGTAYEPFRKNPSQWGVAGKTGTAQVNKKADTSIFAGWTVDPTGAPRAAISVILPESGFGADAAAPLAARYFEALSNGAIPVVTPISPTPKVTVSTTTTTTTTTIAPTTTTTVLVNQKSNTKAKR